MGEPWHRRRHRFGGCGSARPDGGSEVSRVGDALGAIDYVSDGVNLLKNEQSEPMLTVNVGSGDILSSTLGACLAVSSDSCSAGIVTARILTCAGAKTVQYSHSLGSWMVRFFDELTTIDSVAIQEGYSNAQ